MITLSPTKRTKEALGEGVTTSSTQPTKFHTVTLGKQSTTSSQIKTTHHIEKQSRSVTGNPFQFGGAYKDDESCFMYMGHRYYDSRVRGFLSRDPIEDDSLGNLYAAFENNPGMFVDPMGLGIGDWIWEGVKSVGEDLAGGARRTAKGLLGGKKEMIKIGQENERMLNLLGKGVDYIFSDTGPIFEIMQEIWKHIPGECRDTVIKEITGKIAKTAGAYMGGRVVGGIVVTEIAKKISRKIATTAAAKKLASKIGVSAGASSTGIGIPIGATMLQGVLERGSAASRRLRKSHPKIWHSLKNKDLDMIYFLVEDYFKPYLEVINEFKKDSIAFNKKYCEKKKKGYPTEPLPGDNAVTQGDRKGK